jgi:hypothetical protein
MWQYGTFAMFILCISFWIGDLMNSKTKGIISGLLTASVIYIAGYLTGLIPTDQPASLGLGAIISSYGQLLIIVNLGTMVSLDDLLKQWKTVLTCITSLVVMAVIVGAVGTVLFGREIGMLAVAPISGGAVASAMVAEVATEAGRSDLAALAMLFNVIQLLFGVPASSFLLKKYCNKAVATGEHLTYVADGASHKGINFQIFRQLPDSINTRYLILAKLCIVAFAAVMINKASGGSFPVAIAALLLGIILTELGFLDRKSLQKTKFYDFLMFAFMVFLVNAFSSLTLERLISFIVPLVVLLTIGVIALAGGAMIMGTILKIDWRLAGSLGPAAMFGYPFSQLICEDVVREMHLPDDEAEKLLGIVLPQMVIAGFVTVTIASVFIAGVVAPMIFV